MLLEIYASTREEELRQTGWASDQKGAFLRWQFDMQHQWYQTHFKEGSFDLILEHGQPIGRLYVHRQPHDLHVIDISLLPAHRGRGVGTFLMLRLLAEADGASQCVSLHVEFFNRARSLYERLGFRQTGGDGVYIELRREPAGSVSSTSPVAARG